MMRFQLTAHALENIPSGNVPGEAGACCFFHGLVRNHHQGKAVVALEYEARQTLCEKEAAIIFQEAKGLFNVIGLECFHRIGRLQVGEMSVRVAATAAHREDAFRACRYVIDELKKRLPIWKKEHYQNGDSGWIHGGNGGAFTFHTEDSGEMELYSRQINLKEIGAEGQKKLKQARVLVVGAGGLGCSALMSLAGAGVGTVGISEHDHLDANNLHRQYLYRYADVGKPKVELAAQGLKCLNPFIEIKQHGEKIEAGNVGEIINDYDIILDCTDNFTAKFLLNDAAVLSAKPLVHSSIYQFEGQIRTLVPGKTSCLRCLWPQIPSPSCVGTCAEVGVIGAVPAMLGHMQAMEAIKVILHLNQDGRGETVIFNFLNYDFKRIKQLANPGCPLCGTEKKIRSIDPSRYHDQSPFTIDISNLSENELRHYQFIDIREPLEWFRTPVKNIKSTKLPLSRFNKKNYQFDKNQRYIIFCGKGVRSLNLTKQLHEKGITNTFSLVGGTDALKQYFRHSRKETAGAAKSKLSMEKTDQGR